jgi:acyl carrier protein
MSITEAQVLELIYGCIDELNEQLMPEQQLPKDPAVVLFGPYSDLDSLGFVNLIALLEDRSERHFRLSRSLSEGLTDADTDHVHTIRDLAIRISQLVAENTRIEA